MKTTIYIFKELHCFGELINFQYSTHRKFGESLAKLFNSLSYYFDYKTRRLRRRRDHFFFLQLMSYINETFSSCQKKAFSQKKGKNYTDIPL